LSCVYDCALAPLRLPGRIQHSFDQVENTEFLYLYLRDLEKLRKLARESSSVHAAEERPQNPSVENDSFKAAEFFKTVGKHLHVGLDS